MEHGGRASRRARGLVEVALAWWRIGEPAPDAGGVAEGPAGRARPSPCATWLSTLEEAGFLAESDDGSLSPERIPSSPDLDGGHSPGSSPDPRRAHRSSQRRPSSQFLLAEGEGAAGWSDCRGTT